MKHSLLLSVSVSVLALTACTDTTGISAESQKTSHPQSNPNAVVSVVEYGDLQCPACRSAQSLVVKPLLAQYGSKIRFDFGHFPLSSIHPYAMAAAEASECAADQGKFWEFVDMTYTNQEKLNTASLDDWGRQLGLDMDLFGRCRSSNIKRDAVLADYQTGDKLGVNGTPTFFVNGQIVPSTIADLGKAIDAAAGNPGMKL